MRIPSEMLFSETVCQLYSAFLATVLVTQRPLGVVKCAECRATGRGCWKWAARSTALPDRVALLGLPCRESRVHPWILPDEAALWC